MRQLTMQDLIDIRENFPIDDCLPPPPLEISSQMAGEFDQLFQETIKRGPAAQIDYLLPYPKYLFLEHLVQSRGYLLHGSPIKGLDILNPIRETRDSSEFGDQAAIYATPDSIWALFFAVLNKAKLESGISNGAVQLKADDGSFIRRYFFCVDEPSLVKNPWDPGAIYILPPDGFEPDPTQVDVRIGAYTMIVTHWIHRGSKVPVAWLAVEPQDFPFLNNVWGYDIQKFEERSSAPSMAGFPFLSDRSLYPINPLDGE